VRRVFRSGWVIHLLPALLSVVAVFYLGMSVPSGAPGFPHVDKFHHFLAFAFLQVTQARAFRFLWDATSGNRVLWWGALAACAWGGLLEVCQAFVPYRSAELLDLVADTAGSLSAAWVHSRFLSPSLTSEG
jgi:VanZ family protein